MQKKEYMLRAIELAKQGVGWTSPNPLVGAVIVKDGRIIGEGYHEKYGELHAERNAIKHLKESAEGATIYVTLEPCCHYGKQPPCTEAIVEAGIKKVVIGSRDPNPLVAGKGTRFLRAQGIEVEEDFMREEKKSIIMWNLFSAYKTVNSLMWTVALICVLAWIAKFSLMFYDAKQEYTEYNASIKSVTNTVNGTMATTILEISIPGFGTISMNADGNKFAQVNNGDIIKLYYKDGNFTLNQPKKAPAEATKASEIVSKVSLVIWIILFVLDKALLIPFFRYGGIEAWAYNNLYRKE